MDKCHRGTVKDLKEGHKQLEVEVQNLKGRSDTCQMCILWDFPVNKPKSIKYRQYMVV